MKTYEKPKIKVRELVEDETLLAATGFGTGPGAGDYGKDTPGIESAKQSLFSSDKEESSESLFE